MQTPLNVQTVPESPESSPKTKLKYNEVRVSRLKSGEIFASPFVSSDDPGVSVLHLGEVVEAEKLLSITFFHDSKTVEHDVKDSTIASFLKVNDLNTGPSKDVRSSHRESPVLFPRHRR